MGAAYRLRPIRLFALAFSAAVLFPLAAQAVSWRALEPKKEFYVNDFAGLMAEKDKQEIARLGAALEKASGGAQVVVVTVDSLEGEDIRTYGFRLGDKWGIGKKGEDNGVLLLLSRQDRKYAIEIGDGLGGALPDSLAGRIQDEVMAPLLRKGAYSAALLAGYKTIVGLIGKEYGITELEGVSTLPERRASPWQIFVSTLLLIALLSGFRRGGFWYWRMGGGYGPGGGSFRGPRGGGGSFGGGGSSRGF